MNHQLMLTAEVAGGVLGAFSFALNMILLRRTRQTTQICTKLESRIEEEFMALSSDLDTVSRKSGEFASKVAWLESRVRSPRVDPEVTPESVASTTARPSITERRYRVLSLARRGQDPKTIASTLGIPHGEVELMINLGRAA